ncbi:DegT/DnrJ/EryC1/StrS family aminotransferase [Hwanghaeella sp.]|uniref:DegT/DnrJ/EryC1/StrS family aminotransferase n=1 Tax=Hwanghaeella sp. TaxID=2605943 RepID=UPI003CCB7A26
MADSLALFGGAPARTTPFNVEPMVDGAEEEMVLRAVREKNFSRYIGSVMPNMEDVLRMPSAEAASLSEYWHFLGGENVRQFSAGFAAKMGAKYAIPINAATTGISVALAAARVGPGDEVIVPAISYTATGSAVLLFNSIPVFVDVEPDTFCIDPKKVEEAITPRTKAILPVHLTGNVANMDALNDIADRHGLVVIEDAAQAPGAKWRDRMVGTIGKAGVFSLQQSKNIMTGEGGMIVTDDPELARRARLIINHGEVVFEPDDDPSDMENIIGCNFRMPELCAAVGRAQLEKLDTVNDWRSRNADILREELSGLPGIDLPPSQRHGNGPAEDVPHLFVALHNAEAMGCSRAVFVAALRAEGIPVGTGYLRTMYANPTFLNRVAYGAKGCPWTCNGGGSPDWPVYEAGMCPVAESLLEEKFLWFYHIAHPSTEQDMRDIGRAVKKVVAERANLAGLTQADLGALAKKSQGRIGT